VEWDNNGKGQLSKPKTLIPASSVKGALAHRVAFHYNKLMKRFAGSTENAPKVGGENEAVRQLFGYSDDKVQERGNILFSDIIATKKYSDKIINHVSIDRFTGGAMEGALFNEKATYAKGEEIKMTVLVNQSVKDENVIKAWENTLNDLCKSMLPLGGAVNKGYGMFTGDWNKD
jgi:CRISPR/Cas system CSM-associated protein Csm3 (group 7 of RAMP superfamily)